MLLAGVIMGVRIRFLCDLLGSGSDDVRFGQRKRHVRILVIFVFMLNFFMSVPTITPGDELLYQLKN